MKHSSSGVTLTELVVASVIMSMMLAAIWATDYALRLKNKEVSSDAQIFIQTRALAEKIRMSVRSVHGSPQDTGMNVNIGTKTLCFRQDLMISGAYTPGDYTDDRWVCYTQVAGGGGTNVYSCTFDGSPGQCTASGTFEGTVVADAFTNAAIPDPAVTADADAGKLYFEMTVVSRKTPSAGAAVTGGVLTSGTTDNPQAYVALRENVGGF